MSRGRYWPLRMASQRKYEAFPGKTQFFCKGKLVTVCTMNAPRFLTQHAHKQGPQLGTLYMSLAMIIIPVAVFSYSDLPWATQRGTAVIPVLFALDIIALLAALFATAFVDPGIIPRAPRPVRRSSFRTLGLILLAGADSRSRDARAARSSDI